MSSIKTLIIDDEPLAQEVLETYIQQTPVLELVGKCSNAFQAQEALQSMQVDLLLLDIQMPQISGIEFLKSLADPPLVIFTTAFPDYAVDGFDLNAVDYLLKPFSIDRFTKAINKVSALLLQSKAEIENHTDPQEDFFFAKADKKLIKIKHSDVLYIEGLKDYVIIRQESGRVITLQTMKSLEDKLPRQIFRRIHRSYIVNITRITAILGNHVELMEAGKTKILPIGKNYKDELHDVIYKNKL